MCRENISFLTRDCVMTPTQKFECRVGVRTWLLVENRRISYCTPWNAMSIQSTLPLGRDDQVKIVLLLGKTHDADGNNLTIIMSAGCKRKDIV